MNPDDMSNVELTATIQKLGSISVRLNGALKKQGSLAVSAPVDPIKFHKIKAAIDRIVLLQDYCRTKKAAHLFRESGNVAAGTYYEQVCDTLYYKMPSSMRW